MLLELLENNLDIDAGEQIPEDLESFVVRLTCTSNLRFYNKYTTVLFYY